jgi:chromosomal replication initiator protein
VGERNFEAWIAPLQVRWTPDAVRLEAPDRIASERVARHFASAIDEALRAAGVVGTLSIEVAAPPPRLPIRLEPPPFGHTFASFVIGRSNESAHGAARDLVGRHRSPLFLHGPSGVGKTHLLHAVWHELDACGLLVACLPAAELVAALVTAYGTGGHATFWRDLSPVRALLLDDVHSLAGQAEVQERLMDGLAGWMEDGRLLALTSDRPPDEIPRLTEAVRRHCDSGVIATISRPEPALRVAILEHKAEAWGLTLDHGVAARIGGAIGGNVRRLEGALTRLVAHARLGGRRIDEALALEILPELRASALPTVKIILETTAAVFGVRARLLLGRSRRPEFVLPRQVAMYLARRLLQRPFAELAAEFARDHTTVLQAWRQMSRRLGADRALGRLVTEVERRLGMEHLPDERPKNVEAR